MQENQIRRVGTVAHVVVERGYFFIYYRGRQIFCHASKWSELDMPAVNDVVSFEVGPATNPRHQFEAVKVRPEAIDARPVDTIQGGIDALRVAEPKAEGEHGEQAAPEVQQ